MTLILLLIVMIFIVASGIVIIRNKGSKGYKQLRSSLLWLSNNYSGKLDEKGGFEGLSVEINFEGTSVILNTVVTERRRFINRYAVNVSINYNDNTKVHRKEFSISNAISHMDLVKGISSTISEIGFIK